VKKLHLALSFLESIANIGRCIARGFTDIVETLDVGDSSGGPQDQRFSLPIRQHFHSGSILSLSPTVDQMLAFHTIAQQCAHGAQTFKQGC
jgi:hypothetical protein